MLEDAKDFDRVVAVGGDGTVSGVCYELRGSGVPMLPYPAGTTNLLALNLRLPSEPSRSPTSRHMERSARSTSANSRASDRATNAARRDAATEEDAA